MNEPGDAECPFWLVVRARVTQPHKTQQAALDQAHILAEGGERAFVCAPVFDVRPSSVVVSCV